MFGVFPPKNLVLTHLRAKPRRTRHEDDEKKWLHLNGSLKHISLSFSLCLLLRYVVCMYVRTVIQWLVGILAVISWPLLCVPTNCNFKLSRLVIKIDKTPEEKKRKKIFFFAILGTTNSQSDKWLTYGCNFLILCCRFPSVHWWKYFQKC